MNQPVYLKPWIHKRPWLARILLGLVMLSGVFQFGVFALSQNFVISYLGAQPEDVTLGLQLTYVGILVMLPMQFRFQRYFNIRNYLLFLIFFGIILSFACIYVNNLIIFFIIRFFQGIVVCGMAASMLFQISLYLKPEYRQAGASSVLYGSVLANSTLIGMIAANVVLDADFQMLYNYIILFLVCSAIIILLCFRSRVDYSHYPLWQIDWVGAVFFISAGVALAYTLIYGSKYYWLSDTRIRVSMALFTAAALFYILRELNVRRPLVELRVLRFPGVWIGLFLLALYYGLKESINLIFGYTATVLQWSPGQTTLLGIFNILGLLFTMLIAVRVLVKKPHLMPALFLSGFSLLIVYHIWIYFCLTPDLSFTDLTFPVLIQGMSSGIMFVPIVVFIIKNASPIDANAGLVIGAYTRFIALLNVSAGFFNLQQFYSQKFRESFLLHLTPDDLQTSERLNMLKGLYLTKGYTPEVSGALSNIALSKSLGVQTQMLTLKAIFLNIAIISGIVMLIIALSWFAAKLNHLLRTR